MIVIDNIDWIITVDPSRRMIRSGRIVLKGDRIVAVDKAGAPPVQGVTDVIDGRGLIAVPGLIDTSVAVVQQLGRGLGDFCDIPEYRLNRVGRYESALTPGDARIAAQHFCIEMIRAGATSFVDMGSRFPVEIATVAAEYGLRAVVGFSAQDIYDTTMGACPPSMERLDPIDEAKQDRALHCNPLACRLFRRPRESASTARDRAKLASGSGRRRVTR
jgi:5-methylthioadenosine/S-adenosylhomocysteine deaminase